ncbi:hypothetical protein PENTCL1PPCAC_20078, partial [Pristionchus entomophagus]
YFFCVLCNRPLFNHKQALIHFMSQEHRETETWAEEWSHIKEVRRVLDLFTKLPARLEEEDTAVEQKRHKMSWVGRQYTA